MRLLQLGILVLGALSVAACHGQPPAVLLADLKQWDAASSSGRRAAADAVAAKEPDFAFVRMETFSCGGQTHEVAIFHHEKTGLDFVLVPGGTFVMGSPETEKERFDWETQHTVTLTKPLLICRTQCTQAAWRRLMATDPSHFKGDDLPVDSVSWHDASAFCAKVGLDLPTEAQWEWACRAGTTTAYSFGEDEKLLDEYAWNMWNSDDSTHAVGTKHPNAFGLFDVHGNVLEWCLDVYNDKPRTDSDTDPLGKQSPSQEWVEKDAEGFIPYRERVIRGGYWYDGRDYPRSAHRSRECGMHKDDQIGFRPAKTLHVN
jgi:formylglycine-generating enzyme required for sulfatase activity